MERRVSATEANRNFSEILREVRDGDTYLVTSHGRPVARIVPASSDEERRKRAFDALLKRLRTQEAIDIGPWTREELYEDED